MAFYCSHKLKTTSNCYLNVERGNNMSSDEDILSGYTCPMATSSSSILPTLTPPSWSVPISDLEMSSQVSAMPPQPKGCSLAPLPLSGLPDVCSTSGHPTTPCIRFRPPSEPSDSLTVLVAASESKDPVGFGQSTA